VAEDSAGRWFAIETSAGIVAVSANFRLLLVEVIFRSFRHRLIYAFENFIGRLLSCFK